MIRKRLCPLPTDNNPDCTYTIQNVCKKHCNKQNQNCSEPTSQKPNKKFPPCQQKVSVCPAIHTYLCDLRSWEILLKSGQSPLSDVSCGSTTIVLFSIFFGALSKVFNSRISSHTVFRSQALMYRGVNSS